MAKTTDKKDFYISDLLDVSNWFLGKGIYVDEKRVISVKWLKNGSVKMLNLRQSWIC